MSSPKTSVHLLCIRKTKAGSDLNSQPIVTQFPAYLIMTFQSHLNVLAGKIMIGLASSECPISRYHNTSLLLASKYRTSTVDI